MARSRGGRVSKSASQTLPVRGTQPRPLIGVKNVQTMITHFSSQGRSGQAQEGDQTGRNQVHNGPIFQAQPAQGLVAGTVQADTGQGAAAGGEVQPNQPALPGLVAARGQDQGIPPVHHEQEVPMVQDVPAAAHSQHDDLDQPHLGGLQLDLAAWIDPAVPEAEPEVPPEDTDGWNMIDSLGAWECGLCQFKTLEEVPPLTDRSGPRHSPPF